MEYSDEDEIDEMEFTKMVIEYMKKERAALKKAGLDVDFMIRQLESLVEEVEDTKAHMDDLKLQMLMSMSNSLTKQPGPTMEPTKHLDMAAKELRKDEEVIEYFRRLRRRLERFESDKKDASGREGRN